MCAWIAFAKVQAEIQPDYLRAIPIETAMHSSARGKMMTSPGRTFFVALLIVFSLFSVAPTSGQAVQPEKPPMADDVFKNIKVLKGLTVDQFMGTMGFIAAALSMNCSECHDTSSSAAFALDTNPRKLTARRMIAMVNTINKSNFGGKREVTCFTCHRGDVRPKVTPSLAQQYSVPPTEDANDVEPIDGAGANTASADQVFSKYIEALGGAQRLASLTSFVAHGNYEGFDTEGEKVALDIYAKAPNQLSTIVHLKPGDNIRTYDGRNFWTTSAGTFLPLPVLQMTGGELEGAKMDAALSFPAQIKQALKDWRTGFPTTTIDDKEVDVVQGFAADNTPVKLYFDKKSALLVRQVRFTSTVLGLNPIQIDYADYRDVSGVKMPFHWTTTWTDGRSVTDLLSVQPNVAINAARFARPAPTVPRAP
jgi:photosynthetic reaction center cytochrome c subunit